MRDPWFPTLLIFIVLLSIWLGILGPLPNGFAVWLQGWQTLGSAGVAIGAAFIALRNTNRSLAHAEHLETRRRRQKHIASRAMLPIALSEVVEYAALTAHALQDLIPACHKEALSLNSTPIDFVKPLPSDAIKLLADFIEYSDTANTDVIASTVTLIQIHDSRLRGIHRDNHDHSLTRIVVQSELEVSILDAASIYAGASSAFNYARRRRNDLPSELSWDEVFVALRILGFHEDEYPRVYEATERHATLAGGPFERFTASLPR